MALFSLIDIPDKAVEPLLVIGLAAGAGWLLYRALQKRDATAKAVETADATYAVHTQGVAILQELLGTGANNPGDGQTTTGTGLVNSATVPLNPADIPTKANYTSAFGVNYPGSI